VQQGKKPYISLAVSNGEEDRKHKAKEARAKAKVRVECPSCGPVPYFHQRIVAPLRTEGSEGWLRNTGRLQLVCDCGEVAAQIKLK